MRESGSAFLLIPIRNRSAATSANTAPNHKVRAADETTFTLIKKNRTVPPAPLQSFPQPSTIKNPPIVTDDLDRACRKLTMESCAICSNDELT
jgi:hypothetical protein